MGCVVSGIGDTNLEGDYKSHFSLDLCMESDPVLSADCDPIWTTDGCEPCLTIDGYVWLRSIESSCIL